MARVWMPLLLALPLLLGAACPRKRGNDCRHESSERCLWEQGVDGEGEGIDEPEPGDDGEQSDGSPISVRDELERTLDDIVGIMHTGLEWSLVDARARELCRTRDADGVWVVGEVTPAEQGDAWSCLLTGLELEGQALVLEASAGVISLTADELTGVRSEELAAFARALFERRCADGFEEVESKREIFHRCPLPEGPYLVVARFPHDVEADRWQLSIAIVDAG